MEALLLLLVLASFATGTIGCLPGDDNSNYATQQPCSDGGGCPDATVCAYSIWQSCYAPPICISRQVVGCPASPPVMCGCDGGAIVQDCQLGSAYSPAPVVNGCFVHTVDGSSRPD